MDERLPAILDKIKENGGRVERYTEGIWRLASENTPPGPDGPRAWMTTTPFIEELVLLQLMEWQDFARAEHGIRLPQAAQVRKKMVAS